LFVWDDGLRSDDLSSLLEIDKMFNFAVNVQYILYCTFTAKWDN